MYSGCFNSWYRGAHQVLAAMHDELTNGHLLAFGEDIAKNDIALATSRLEEPWRHAL